VCEEQLGDTQIMFTERSRVEAHQFWLTRRRASLFSGKVGWPLLELENTNPGCDRGAADQNAGMSGLLKFRDLFRDARELGCIEGFSRRGGKNSRAEFDDYSLHGVAII
jgi:hypothetical protein